MFEETWLDPLETFNTTFPQKVFRILTIPIFLTVLACCWIDQKLGK